MLNTENNESERVSSSVVSDSLQPHGLLTFSSPGDLPNPGIEPGSPALQADSLPAELPVKPMCWQFDLWFLCLFEIQLEYLEVLNSHIVEV